MKKLFLASSALFMAVSCQNETATGIDQTSEMSAVSSKTPETARISLEKSIVLAESPKISRLGVVYPTVGNQDSYYGVRYGNTRVILDLQADGNLILKAVHINPDGSAGLWKDLWTSNTGGRQFNIGRALVAEADGNLILYGNGYNNTENYWNAQAGTGGVVQNPVIKVQFIKVTNALNTGSPKYVGKLILEGNGEDRKVIGSGEFQI
ncbi:hypothetical protein [Chryseobacterium sp.]|uniref:hypothetical protein n=1 Tax=Chryseobacterium sp. TaxID=1871047 RepID=UPI0025BFB6FB|nr:hypothetical protein [Chryseobacterium sp.]MBV8327207.1 hypothetical protein [Chryseobacterium sp.]